MLRSRSLCVIFKSRTYTYKTYPTFAAFLVHCCTLCMLNRYLGKCVQIEYKLSAKNVYVHYLHCLHRIRHFGCYTWHNLTVLTLFVNCGVNKQSNPCTVHSLTTCLGVHLTYVDLTFTFLLLSPSKLRYLLQNFLKFSNQIPTKSTSCINHMFAIFV